MTQIISFKCDGCSKVFLPRNEAGQVQAVGGASGFYHKSVMNAETKILEKKLLQYSFDFCVECNKKVMDFIVKEFKI